MASPTRAGTDKRETWIMQIPSNFDLNDLQGGQFCFEGEQGSSVRGEVRRRSGAIDCRRHS